MKREVGAGAQITLNLTDNLALDSDSTISPAVAREDLRQAAIFSRDNSVLRQASVGRGSAFSRKRALGLLASTETLRRGLPA